MQDEIDPIPSMSARDLSVYRGQLERALQDRTIGKAPVAAMLRRKLAQVLAELEVPGDLP